MLRVIYFIFPLGIFIKEGAKFGRVGENEVELKVSMS